MYLNPHIGRWWSIVGTPSLKWTPFVTKKRNPKQKKNHREKKLWLSKIFVRPLLKKYIAKIKTDKTAFEQEKLKYFYEIMFPLKKKMAVEWDTVSLLMRNVLFTRDEGNCSLSTKEFLLVSNGKKKTKLQKKSMTIFKFTDWRLRKKTEAVPTPR